MFIRPIRADYLSNTSIFQSTSLPLFFDGDRWGANFSTNIPAGGEAGHHKHTPDRLDFLGSPQDSSPNNQEVMKKSLTTTLYHIAGSS